MSDSHKTPEPTSLVGFLVGKVAVPDDFDTMAADEIAEMFEGSDSDE